jgi:hypothetical protein
MFARPLFYAALGSSFQFAWRLRCSGRRWTAFDASSWLSYGVYRSGTVLCALTGPLHQFAASCGGCCTASLSPVLCVYDGRCDAGLMQVPGRRWRGTAHAGAAKDEVEILVQVRTYVMARRACCSRLFKHATSDGGLQPWRSSRVTGESKWSFDA